MAAKQWLQSRGGSGGGGGAAGPNVMGENQSYISDLQ